VYPPTDEKRAADYLRHLNLRAGEYALFCAGGGGYQHAGVPAPDIFAQAAVEVCREAGIAGVWVRGPNYSGDSAPGPNVVVLPAVATHEMIDLLSGARIAVINGGSLLLQALALKVPCVAAPVAGDQHARIARCARHGAVVPAVLDARALSRATLALLREPAQLHALQTRVAALGLRNGVEQAVSALERLLGSAAA
jgi:UDP:flavonoid glycosyltransferase YjiC (YdhE family)